MQVDAELGREKVSHTALRTAFTHISSLTYHTLHGNMSSQSETKDQPTLVTMADLVKPNSDQASQGDDTQRRSDDEDEDLSSEDEFVALVSTLTP